jgi:phosphoglycerol transferase MdoB-like AlkP superfamily enzyme
MQSKLMKRVVSTEYLVAAILVAVFYISVGNFAWYWLPILFVVFDLSAVGYVFNPRIGALVYNLGHSLIGPTLLVAAYIATTNQTVLFIALIWLFHIFVDRALGYGLKHTAGFEHTHLGPIGKAKKK